MCSNQKTLKSAVILAPVQEQFTLKSRTSHSRFSNSKGLSFQDLRLYQTKSINGPTVATS